jgi:alkanesulfonate monooxygenase SsuD/methylene tetrahydromethanopterin reductase-like flavin-dependent oxidoreductase (luciferase family)
VLASPLIGASAVAARTTRIQVGLAVQVLPLANPLRVAEEAAIVDHISQGRLVFGVGRSSFLESYHGYNVEYEESRALFFESLEIIRRAWRDAPLSYDGQYYHFHDVDVVPKPYQQPHPPIRVAVESRDTFPLVGRLGLPIFIRHQMDIPELQGLLKQYQEERHAAGFSGPNDVILQIAAYVADTAEQAYTEPEASTMRQRRLVRESLGRTADQEAFERLRRLSEVTYDDVLPRVAYGTPEAVVERLQAYKEAFGLTGVSLDMNPGGQIPYDRVVHSMRLLTEQVMPHFK